MATWGEVLAELQASASQNGGSPDFDGLRARYLTELTEYTERPVISYSTDWIGGGGAGTITSITLQDMQGMMEVCHGVPGPNLDLILHSPGGSAEATASIVRYLRKKYTNIRVFVPLAAMSAATMLALAADVIVMGKHSQLGPIDPQLMVGPMPSPARAVIDQFEMAKEECSADPSLLGAWAPILQQYGPALINLCERQDKLSRRLVREWLEEYMFAGSPSAGEDAQVAADYFADYGIDGSHALGIDRDGAREVKINVEDLEADQELQDRVLSVHHAAMHTWAGPAVKIIENHAGKRFVQMQQQVTIPLPGAVPGP